MVTVVVSTVRVYHRYMGVVILAMYRRLVGETAPGLGAVPANVRHVRNSTVLVVMVLAAFLVDDDRAAELGFGLVSVLYVFYRVVFVVMFVAHLGWVVKVMAVGVTV